MAKDNINNIEFLNCIYKNADMGLIGINNVIEYVNNQKLKKVLEKEYNEYERIKIEALNLLKQYKYDIQEIGILTKISSAMMVDMALLKDDSKEKIAKMMLEGTNKGIIEIVAKINAYNGKEVKMLVLAKRFKSILENNMEELMKYL